MPSPNRIIIGVCGRAKHGKSRLVHDLFDFFTGVGRLPRTTAFATPIKQMLTAFGLSFQQLYGSEKEKPSPLLGGKTPRLAMQTLGTEWGRNTFDPDIWVRAWHLLVELDNVSDVILVEDVRFESEVRFLQNLGAILVEVYRPAMMPTTVWGWFKFWVNRHRAHASEAADFQALGVQRIVVQEGGNALDDFLAINPSLR